MQRRSFLKLCGSAGVGLAMPLGVSSPVFAENAGAGPEPYEGPYYLVFNASGGWDTTYLMDPKGADDINRLYLSSQILAQGNLRMAPNAAQTEAGMSNEEFLTKYGDDLLVLNGLDYSVNNHSPCSRYMATGKLNNVTYPTFAALVAACKGSQAPLAFLTFGQYSATGNLVPMARVPHLNSLKRLANADSINGQMRSPYHDDFVVDRIEQALRDQMDARASKVRMPRVERSQSMLYAAQLNSKALERVTQYIPKTTPKERLSKQADIALAAFKAGVCVSANLSIGQFDSHANNDTDQMKLIPELLAGVDYLVTKAEELKIRDNLVIVMQSEMGRQPTYNTGDGKDHWSIGSVMFIGHGIHGNRVVGATDEKQFLVQVNPETLSLDEKRGIRIRPEHVHLALRKFAGIEDHPFSEQFPLDVPDGQRLRRFLEG